MTTRPHPALPHPRGQIYHAQDGVPWYDDPSLAGAWSFDNPGEESTREPQEDPHVPNGQDSTAHPIPPNPNPNPNWNGQDNTAHPIPAGDGYIVRDLSRRQNHLYVLGGRGEFLAGPNEFNEQGADTPKPSRHVRHPRAPWQGVFA